MTRAGEKHGYTMGLTAGPDLHLCVCVVATKTLACQALRATCTPVGLMRWSRPPIGLDGKRRNGLGTVQVRETIQRSPSQAPTPTLLADDGVGRASLSPWRSTSDSPHRGVVQAGGCGSKAGTTGNERRPRESNADPCPFLKCGLTCAFTSIRCYGMSGGQDFQASHGSSILLTRSTRSRSSR